MNSGMRPTGSLRLEGSRLRSFAPPFAGMSGFCLPTACLPDLQPLLLAPLDQLEFRERWSKGPWVPSLSWARVTLSGGPRHRPPPHTFRLPQGAPPHPAVNVSCWAEGMSLR